MIGGSAVIAHNVRKCEGTPGSASNSSRSCIKRVVAGVGNLPLQRLHHALRHLVPVVDEGAEPVRIEDGADAIDRLVIGHRAAEHFEDPARCFVAHHDVVKAIEDESGIRFLLPQREFQRPTNMRQLRRTERSLAVDRRVTGADEQRVSLGQWHVEPAGKQLHHFPAWLRPAGLEKTQVPGRDAGFHRQL
jgi:hypothetical protein